jgi:general secretion pathway protein I
MTTIGQRVAETCRLLRGSELCGPLRRRQPLLPRWLRVVRGLLEGTKREGGFTLVEVIVALAILSAGLGLLLGLISNSLRQTVSAQRMAEVGSLAQSLLAEVGTVMPIRPEERDGQYPNGYRWHLKVQPYDSGKESEERPVGLYRISAEIDWDQGVERRFYALTTLRLGPKDARR